MCKKKRIVRMKQRKIVDSNFARTSDFDVVGTQKKRKRKIVIIKLAFYCLYDMEN